jgi:hypothetical protein
MQNDLPVPFTIDVYRFDYTWGKGLFSARIYQVGKSQYTEAELRAKFPGLPTPIPIHDLYVLATDEDCRLDERYRGRSAEW